MERISAPRKRKPRIGFNANEVTEAKTYVEDNEDDIFDEDEEEDDEYDHLFDDDDDDDYPVKHESQRQTSITKAKVPERKPVLKSINKVLASQIDSRIWKTECALRGLSSGCPVHITLEGKSIGVYSCPDAYHQIAVLIVGKRQFDVDPVYNSTESEVLL